MNTRIKHIAVWLSRIAYCRGFGIQSPSAYAFVRYVINEHYPYYAYAELDEAFPYTGITERKLMRLCMRVANHLQPRHIIDRSDERSAERLRYFHAGSQKAAIVSTTPDAFPHMPCGNGDGTLLVRLTATDGASALLEQALDRATPDSILIIDNIYADRRTRALWKQLTADRRTGVSFDLYYCGILMFDKSKHKRSYTINF